MRGWIAVLVLCCCSALAQNTLVYPAPESELDKRFDDIIEILQLALEITEPEFGAVTLMPFPVSLTEGRGRLLLKQTQQLDVIWSATSIQLEEELLPIRIPLRKGLLSYRISLIDQAQQPRMQQINKLADLQSLLVGQGAGWLDSDIYHYNGVRVVTGLYDDLFAMLMRGRFDLFPRGIGEVFQEYELRKGDYPELQIEEALLLYYPWPFYFFVHPSNQELATRIEQGLRMMIHDGSFDAIFYRYNQQAIERAQLSERRLIQLENPFLPAATPIDDPTLWFTPEPIR